MCLTVALFWKRQTGFTGSTFWKSATVKTTNHGQKSATVALLAQKSATVKSFPQGADGSTFWKSATVKQGHWRWHFSGISPKSATVKCFSRCADGSTFKSATVKHIEKVPPWSTLSDRYIFRLLKINLTVALFGEIPEKCHRQVTQSHFFLFIIMRYN